jgi:hypothetical protein
MTPDCDVCISEMRDRPRPGVEELIIAVSGVRFWACRQHLATVETWYGKGPWA